MTNTTYTYEIIAVDEATRCMEVVYTSETHGVMHIGARLPFEGESLEQVIAMFAPVQEWRMRDKPVVAPVVGASGQLADVGPVLPAPRSMEDQARLERDRLLFTSDWTQVADAPVDQAAWAAYRQALRDTPQQSGFPEAVIWPIKPE